MKYVLDASVAVASLLNEPDSAAANALLDDDVRLVKKFPAIVIHLSAV